MFTGAECARTEKHQTVRPAAAPSVERAALRPLNPRGSPFVAAAQGFGTFIADIIGVVGKCIKRSSLGVFAASACNWRMETAWPTPVTLQTREASSSIPNRS